MPFSFRDQTALPGVVLIEPQRLGDSRGSFMETFKRSEFTSAGLTDDFVQENQSVSTRGTLRGLHLQRAPRAQGKLVRVLAGEIFDVAVDVRPDSPTRGKWVSAVLSGENARMLWIPEWCAHGFLVLSETAEVLYKTTAEYSPQDEAGYMWNDPAFGIAWPGEPGTLSKRDREWAAF
ncbi:MAG: dTDP-4-dehydrorhamnose 3,5-epimerase [Bryobacterales bacterium]|nr:dTDP-4-dehydrorhamnose 3,5-epimerase [Bryobacterales bacterium]